MPVAGVKVVRTEPLKPFWATTDNETVRLYLGDVIDVLDRLPARSVHTVITSPPYWGLRSYLPGEHEDKSKEIGSEPAPDEYVAKMVAVFRAVRRVLRDDGTVWLNLGSSYGADGQMVATPWLVALALQADGWVLRQDIIWHKPAPMPESVRNRCTKAHEYLFLLAKGGGYYCDMEAIKEKVTGGTSTPSAGVAAKRPDRGYPTGQPSQHHCGGEETGRANKRSVWTISSKGYEGAHFATFPPKLVEPCLLAGTSARGCCADCGAPWERVVEETQLKRDRPNEYVKRSPKSQDRETLGLQSPKSGLAEPGWRERAKQQGATCANTVAGVEVKTVGWVPTCKCGTDEVVPCTVLDPFVGSGTLCQVAIEHGRRSVGIDLSEQYLRANAVPRVEGVLLARPALAHLAGKVRKAVYVGRRV